jgi:hypothetical protein
MCEYEHEVEQVATCRICGHTISVAADGLRCNGPRHHLQSRLRFVIMEIKPPRQGYVRKCVRVR